MPIWIYSFLSKIYILYLYLGLKLCLRYVSVFSHDSRSVYPIRLKLPVPTPVTVSIPLSAMSVSPFVSAAAPLSASSTSHEHQRLQIRLKYSMISEGSRGSFLKLPLKWQVFPWRISTGDEEHGGRVWDYYRTLLTGRENHKSQTRNMRIYI